MKLHIFRLSGHDFVHYRKIEIGANDRAVYQQSISCFYRLRQLRLVSNQFCSVMPGFSWIYAGIPFLDFIQLPDFEHNVLNPSHHSRVFGNSMLLS